MDRQAQDIAREYFREAVKAVGGSGKKLARMVGLAPSTVNRLLSGAPIKYVPSVTTLRKIAKGSGVAVPTELLGTGSKAEAADLVRIYHELPDDLRASLMAVAVALEARIAQAKAPQKPQ